MASVQYWVSRTKLAPYIERHVNAVGIQKFSSKKEQVLAKELQDTGFPFDKLVEKYWTYTGENDVLKYMIKSAVRASKKPDRVGWAKQFISQYLAELCGSMVRETGSYMAAHRA